MRCGRADRVELDAFLLGASGDEGVDAFRAHYPHCAECAAVVADWMALEGELREVMREAGEPVSTHPEPEDLARFAEAPARMGERAMQIENHLAGCASCSNELVLIRGFDPAMFGAQPAPMPAVARERAPAEAGLFDALREAVADFFESLRGLDLLRPMPALALALILLAAVWWSGAIGPRGGVVPPHGEPQLVERGAPSAGAPSPGRPSPGSSPAASGPSSAVPQDETGLAAGPDAGRVPDAERAPERALVEEPAPVELAQAEPSAEVVPGAPESRPPATPAPKPSIPMPTTPVASKSDEILLAAVNDLPPPSYATPAAAESLVWMRQFGAVRSAPGAAHVRARAPGNHTGLTLSRTPRLWWSLDQRTDLPVQITVVDGEGIDPLLRVELPGPHAAGLHAFDLSQHGVELAPDVDYRWFVSVVVDPDRPSRNPVSAGSLRVAGAGDARRQSVSDAAAPARGNKLAELGLWYDAYDFYASLAAAHPEVERLAAYRDRLVEEARATP